MQGHDDLDTSCGPFAAAAAWGNARALATLLITLGLTVAAGLLVAASATPVAYPIGAILAAVLAALGISAAGSQFVEQAAGRPVSSVARAFAATPRILLGSVLLTAVLVAVLAAFVLVSAAMLYACRLPVVGPLLLLVVVPALTIGGAALLAALAAAALLALAALWEGHSLRTALSQLCAIVAQRKHRVWVDLLLPLLVAAGSPRGLRFEHVALAPRRVAGRTAVARCASRTGPRVVADGAPLCWRRARDFRMGRPRLLATILIARMGPPPPVSRWRSGIGAAPRGSTSPTCQAAVHRDTSIAGEAGISDRGARGIRAPHLRSLAPGSGRFA